VTRDRDVLHVELQKEEDHRQGIKLLVMFACWTSLLHAGDNIVFVYSR